MKEILLCVLSFFWISSPVFAAIHYPHASTGVFSQKKFDEGMLAWYGYAYFQAEYDFRQALLKDPQCAVCYWGLAIAKKQQAVELNKPFAVTGYEDMQKAARLISRSNKFQYDLVHAALQSFSSDPSASDERLQTAYINQLRILYRKYRNDPVWQAESLALLVDALFYSTGTASQQHRQEARSLLRAVLQKPPFSDHPGLLHTYIHLAEKDLQDPLAEQAAKKLPGFSQGMIAHYAHMPNHIYWRRGMYDKAIKANLDAIAIDNQYFLHNGPALNTYYYEYHYLHSYHFLAVLGVLTNNFPLAVRNARALKKLANVCRLETLKNYRDILLSQEHMVLARFGKWKEILNLKVPERINQPGILFVRFAKSLAYLHLGKIGEFKKLNQKIRSSHCSDALSCKLKTLMVSYIKASEMEYHHASLSRMERYFLKRQSGRIEMTLSDMNPPVWYFPYTLFLSDAAFSRGDRQSAKKYHVLYEKIYPHSTLGAFPGTRCAQGWACSRA